MLLDSVVPDPLPKTLLCFLEKPVEAGMCLRGLDSPPSSKIFTRKSQLVSRLRTAWQDTLDKWWPRGTIWWKRNVKHRNCPLSDIPKNKNKTKKPPQTHIYLHGIQNVLVPGGLFFLTRWKCSHWLESWWRRGWYSVASFVCGSQIWPRRLCNCLRMGMMWQHRWHWVSLRVNAGPVCTDTLLYDDIPRAFTHIPEKPSHIFDFRVWTKQPYKGLTPMTSPLGQCPFFTLKANTLC